MATVGGMADLLLGLIVLIPGMILLAPFCLSLAARIGRRAPIAPRLALRDLARYRARSGSALSAISLGVLIAVIVSLAAAARYGNVLDYAGPNLSSNQLCAHANIPPPAGTVLVGPGGKQTVAPAPSSSVPSPADLAASAHRIAARSWCANDRARVAKCRDQPRRFGTDLERSRSTSPRPSCSRPSGSSESEIQPDADILTARPGLSGVSGLYLTYGSNGGDSGGPVPGNGNGPGTGQNGVPTSCSAATDCLANPVIQEVSALPAGTSAPNTVITEHAMHQFHLQASTGDWLVQGSQPFTAAQISSAAATASTSALSVESKNDQPTSAEVINWATVFGIILALGILAMSVGLIRSETASDLRTLAASGASSFTRRTLTAVTAGALGLLGALVGTVVGYIALIGWLQSNSLNGGISALGNVPVTNLLLILVAMPLVATIVGWLFAGREPKGLAWQPME